MRKTPLFSEYDLRATLKGAEAKLKDAVDAYDSDRLLNANQEDLVQYFVESATVTPLQFMDDDITADTEETKVDVSHRFEDGGGFDDERVVVPGTAASLHVPFEGDASLFRCVASNRNLNPPYGQVSGQELILSFVGTDGDMARAKAELDSQLQNVRQHVAWIARDVASYNERLPQIARDAVVSRRRRLLEQRNLAASLGYAVRPKEGAPRTYAVPAKRRTIQTKRQPGSGSRFVPEPVLDKTTYEGILTVLANMVQVMEESPDAFANLGEEDLRTHFLVQLNGQFEVGVTGETFRGSGSTDILLGLEGRNVFLAECKFWRGPKSLLEALDQLLDYALWRDAKAALLVFNRNKDFTSVLAKIPQTLREHDRIASEIAKMGDSGFRFSLRQRDDPDRLIEVTLLAFDVPTARTRSGRLAERSPTDDDGAAT